MAPSEPGCGRFRVQAMHLGAEQIHLYELVPVTPMQLPEVEPGAHIDLQLPNGLLRQYSLISPLCDARRYLIAVKREAQGRGASRWLHDQLRLGQTLEVSACRNSFPLRDTEDDYLLLAGGIGITPIYSMYRHLQAQGKRLRLHYWGRSADTMLFHEALQAEADATLHAGQEAPRPRLQEVLAGVSQNTSIYCCGPQSMIDELQATAAEQGLERVYHERFGKAVIDTEDSDSFEMVLARSGRVIAVAKDETMLEALIKQEVEVMYSCEQGICGACEVRCLEGDILHLDSVQTAAEHEKNGTVMVCCSRAASARIVLDI